MEEINEVIICTNGIVALDKDLEDLIIDVNEAKKSLEKLEKEIREKLIQAMQENNVKSVKTDNVIVTVKDSYDKETFDSKKFREDHADLYDEYVKFSTVKESLQIKVSDND